MGLATAATARAPPRHGRVSLRRQADMQELRSLRTVARLSRGIGRRRSGAVLGGFIVTVARTTGGTGRTGRGGKSGRSGYIDGRAAMTVVVRVVRSARGVLGRMCVGMRV